jgi:GNAT superfamily N-acetyltransferase
MKRSDSESFRWLYCDGPHGVARAWVAVDDENGEIVGAAGAFPRKLYFGGKEGTGFVLGDFCMNEKYRSLGPSIQLQRACINAIGEGPFEFFYDFPSPGMIAVYGRLGIQPILELVRWAKPLRAERKLEALVGSKGMARRLGAIADFVLARRGRKGNKEACDLALQEGLCGEEFTVLDNQIRLGPGVKTARTAAYLNWRYQLQPGSRHQLLTARKGGQLIGYAVYATDEGDSSIVDLSSTGDPAVIFRLLEAAVAHLRALGAATVSLHAGNTHPWSALFEHAGFRRRESVPVIVHARKGAPFSDLSFQQQWFVMRGERDC